jgi:DNA-binding transcriptional MerR regulator
VFKIGEFSRLTRVTVKALRHYDRLGLLRPTAVDRQTGYRYYSLDQLPRLNRLLALKDLGLSLEQVRTLLDDALPAAEIRGMLRLKRAELRRRLIEEHARLARVEARLREIDLEGRMPGYDVVLKKVDALTVASVREVVPTIDQMPERCSAMYVEALEWTRRSGARVAGACMGLYHNSGYTERDIDTEMAIPIETDGRAERGPAEASRVRVRELPGAAAVASVVHRGPYDELSLAWQALGRWVEANGYRMAGPGREIYLRTPDQGEPLAEVQVPVERA